LGRAPHSKGRARTKEEGRRARERESKEKKEKKKKKRKKEKVRGPRGSVTPSLAENEPWLVNN